MSNRRSFRLDALVVVALSACTSESSAPRAEDAVLDAGPGAQPGTAPNTDPNGATDGGSAAADATVDGGAPDARDASATDAAPPHGPLRAFLSSQRYKGALGGPAGADAKCTQLATAAGLGGKWMAWISSMPDNSQARDRLTSAGPWQTLDGKVVASKADLVAGQLAAVATALDETETKAIITSEDEYAWTGIFGNVPHALNCEGWTTASASVKGFMGRVIGITYPGAAHWQSIGAYPCDSELRLYCFEL
ncbi:hypothetical protein BH11MYX4_BH11MYX4_07260 [soil metagenome]